VKTRRHSTHLHWAVLTVLFCIAVFAGQAPAQGWEVSIRPDSRGPRTFLAVDKSTQTFFVFEQKSPLKIAGQYACATGQALGDKLKQGDLRTPEGVYFIQNRMASGLDYSLYGDLAFTLNFPNPVDVINGKSGGGIWIHGRGKELSPNETKGCVAINTPDLHKLDGTFTRGMPVVIASRVAYATDAKDQSAEGAELANLTMAWAKAWQRRSDEFFAFHDPEKFALSSGAPFKTFVDHKKQLFSSLPWLQVVLDNVQTIAGPGYWVTYFGQYYRSPSLTSEGIKRLYWQRDKAGKWRIVGMEMDECNLGLEAKYLNRASQEIASLIESWRVAWEKGNLNEYASYYSDKAVQGDRRGRASIKEQKQALWAAKAPKKVVIKDIRVRLHGDGVEAQFVQEYAAKDGTSDKGRKLMTFVPQGDGWAIAGEEWSKL